MATAGKNLSNYDLESLPNGAHFKVGIAVSEWNRLITEGLLEGACEVLRQSGIPDDCLMIKWVPGSFELPLAAQWLTADPEIDGVICIGSVIRGETAHFEYVCEATANGIMRVNLDSNKPVMFCVLTDDNKEQAEARSGGNHGNKGVEAAVGLLNMLAIR